MKIFSYLERSIQRRHLVILIVILVALSITLAVRLNTYLNLWAPADVVPVTISPPVLNKLIKATPKVDTPLPVRLKIPAISVNASLEYVGLTSNGHMGVPTVPAKAAWFNLGPRPGEIGSAVIDGHFGIWQNGQTSVFDNLYKLRKGDKLTVEDQKGVAITFVVTELRIYDQNQDATDVFSSNDGLAHLNLITCEGVWSRFKQSFPSRLVVFTTRE